MASRKSRTHSFGKPSKGPKPKAKVIVWPDEVTPPTVVSDAANRFAGSCSVCQEPVARGAGTVSNETGKWLVLCAEHSPVIEAAPKPEGFNRFRRTEPTP